ncbi:MAG: HEAT repeat domain-containing protein [Chloroflexota bacterium]
MKFRIDTISFLLGMAVATAVWWAMTLLRSILVRLDETLKLKKKEHAQQGISKLEFTYLNSVFKQTQAMHLASSLFTLDEIAETPRLLAPPVIFEPNGTHFHQDIVELTLPYIPNFPELGTHYNAPTLSLFEAISGGMNLAVIGQPGTGKTTALALLASEFAKPTPNREPSQKRIPFLIHVTDLGLPLISPKKPEDFLSPIVAKTIQSMGVFDSPNIPKFVENAFVDGKAILLLDGVDELPQSMIQEVYVYLRMFLRNYSKTKVIITGAPEYLGGILSLGFTPMAIMPWSVKQQSHFLKNWSSVWEKYVTSEPLVRNTSPKIDPLLLQSWLTLNNFALTPLEFTLKIWGAFAGDIPSLNNVDLIGAHLKRLTPTGIPADAVAILAANIVLEETCLFDSKQAREWTKAFEGMDSRKSQDYEAPAFIPGTYENIGEAIDLDLNDETQKTTRKNPVAPSRVGTGNLFSVLVSSGLLTSQPGNKFRFSHPVFLGFLASKGIAIQQKNIMTLLNQPRWSGQTTSIRYLATIDNPNELVMELLSRDDPILNRPIFTAARMLRDTKQARGSSWQGKIMSALVQILQSDDNPFSLRGEALTALAFGGDVSVNTLFRQFLQSPSAELRQLAALGVGLIRDTKAVDALMDLAIHPLEATRRAACLALVEIGTPNALESVARYLLQGDELLRIYAAEALANHPQDGFEALREGLASDDILIRRAIVFGLGRINETWSTELLEITQLNDEQWAVRNLAIEILRNRLGPNQRIPKKPEQPHETPWLIEFAGKHGTGVTPGQPATDILLKALKDPNRDLFLPALHLLRNSPNEEVLSSVYLFLNSMESYQRDAVYHMLTDIALNGTTLPYPNQSSSYSVN